MSGTLKQECKRMEQNRRVRRDFPFVWAISLSWDDFNDNLSVHPLKEGSDYFQLLADHFRQSGPETGITSWLYLENDYFEIVEPIVCQAQQRIWEAVCLICKKHPSHCARAVIVEVTAQGSPCKNISVYRTPKNTTLITLYSEKMLRGK